MTALILSLFLSTADGGSGGSVTPPPTAAVCHDSMCGVDDYCSCHPTADKDRRCWSQNDDCVVDAVCCLSAADGGCSTQGIDACSKVTHDTRVKRDQRNKP